MELTMQAAFNAYVFLGFRPGESTFPRLTLGVGKKRGLFSDVMPTEQYVYEEIIFHINTAREAQGLCGFLDHVIRITRRDVVSHDHASADAVQGMMISIGHFFAESVLTELNISTSRDSAWFADFGNRKIHSYEASFREHYGSSAPIETGNLRVGFSPRNHPTLKYLGTITDCFCAALDLKQENPQTSIHAPLLETCLLARYNSLISSLPEIARL